MTALPQSTRRKLSLLQLAEELNNVSKASHRIAEINIAPTNAEMADRILDQGDEAHRAGAAGTDQDVLVVRPLHRPRPIEPALSRRVVGAASDESAGRGDRRRVAVAQLIGQTREGGAR